MAKMMLQLGVDMLIIGSVGCQPALGEKAMYKMDRVRL